jgi:hypothetical protein
MAVGKVYREFIGFFTNPGVTNHMNEYKTLTGVWEGWHTVTEEQKLSSYKITSSAQN